MQDVLVLSRFALDERGARGADGFVLGECIGEVDVEGKTLAQRCRILEALGGALSKVGKHGVTAIANESDLARGRYPAAQDGQVAEAPLHEISRKGAEFAHSGLPGAEAFPQLSVVTLDDPDLVSGLVVRRGAYDNVVQLSISDGITDKVSLWATPGGGAWIGDEGGEVRVVEELLAVDEDAGSGD